VRLSHFFFTFQEEHTVIPDPIPINTDSCTTGQRMVQLFQAGCPFQPEGSIIRQDVSMLSTDLC